MPDLRICPLPVDPPPLDSARRLWDEVRRRYGYDHYQFGLLFPVAADPPLPPHPDTRVDEAEFLKNLKRSLRYYGREKMRIVGSLPHFDQQQVEVLMALFCEEMCMLESLDPDHLDDLMRWELFAVEEWRKEVDSRGGQWPQMNLCDATTMFRVAYWRPCFGVQENWTGKHRPLH